MSERCKQTSGRTVKQVAQYSRLYLWMFLTTVPNCLSFLVDFLRAALAGAGFRVPRSLQSHLLRRVDRVGPLQTGKPHQLENHHLRTLSPRRGLHGQVRVEEEMLLLSCFVLNNGIIQ